VGILMESNSLHTSFDGLLFYVFLSFFYDCKTIRGVFAAKDLPLLQQNVDPKFCPVLALRLGGSINTFY